MKQILSYIPGFRSGKKINMLFATIYYLFSLLFFIARLDIGLFFLSSPFLLFYGLRFLRRNKLQLGFKQAIIPFLVALIVFSGSNISIYNNYQEEQQVLAQKAAEEAEQKAIEEAEKKSAEEIEAVFTSISSIPNEIDLSYKDDIVSARKAYDLLSSEQKNQITNIVRLESAEEKLVVIEADKTVADEVVSVIASLPDSVTLADEEIVKSAQTAYDNLTDSQKEYVTNVDQLSSSKKMIEDEKEAIRIAAEEKAAAEKKAAQERAAAQAAQKKSYSSSSSSSSSTSNSSPASAEQTTEVLVTRTGEKYHRRACGNGDYYSATLSEAKARGLTPCKKCF